MSNDAPIPNWRGPLTGGSAQTAVNIDGFGAFAPVAGGHGYNKLQEPSSSGAYTLAYEFKFTMILVGTAADVYGYGNLGYFNRGNVFGGWIIENSTITPGRGAKMTVTIQWQSLSGYLPPDEWQVTQEDLRPRVERNPIFRPLTVDDFATVKLAFQAATINGRATGLNQLNATSNPTLASNLLEELLNGSEEYYLPGANYSWSTYYLPSGVPPLNEGGTTYILPGGPAGYILPYGFNWLRHADQVMQASYGPLGGIVKLTREWVGCPSFGGVAFWSPLLYPSSGF